MPPYWPKPLGAWIVLLIDSALRLMTLVMLNRVCSRLSDRYGLNKQRARLRPEKCEDEGQVIA